MKGDTISRSALIAEIKKWTTDCACIELIENEPAVDAAPEWISVEDRLPSVEDQEASRCWDYMCNVMIPDNKGGFDEEYIILRFNNLNREWECKGMIVTHWMPLPKPPQEKET